MVKNKLIAIITILLFWIIPLSATDSGVTGIPLDNMELAGGMGFSYIYRPLKNSQGYADNIRSFQILFRGGIGITSYINLFLMGGFNDARRELEGFRGTLSPFYGAGIRIIPLSQYSSIINAFMEADATYSKITGISRGQIDTLYWIKFDTKVGISKFFNNYLGFYGGIKYSYQIIKQVSTGEKPLSQLPWGIFLGADYFVTPYVFFETEMHNFDQDALFLLVGTKF